MPQLAQRVGRAKPSAIMVIAEKAKQLKAAGRDIISFSIGVPNFLPGEHVYAAAREALSHDSGQYGSNRGADALLDAFLKHIEALGFTGYGRMNLSIGIGAKQVLYNLADHDGKMRTHAAQHRPAGTLPADVTNASPAPIEAEDVVAVSDSGSAWEAREDEAERSRPPPARGVGRPR